jgi:hypothetical protein
MEDPVRISTLPPERSSQDFAFLREQGLNLIQQIASQTWTDHNLHDPGITLLEVICYALTELGLRSGMELPDLLASSSSDAPPEMFSAASVLPCAPVTTTDFRKLLIDHPLIANAWVFNQHSEPKGRLDILLEFEQAELNSNTFTLNLTPPSLSSTYQVDLALPFWDEPDVEPLREDVTLQSVVLAGAPGNIWRPIEESGAHFARATVTYQTPTSVGPEVLQIWIVARITEHVDESVFDPVPILQEAADVITTLGDNSPSDQTLLKRYNRRISAAHESMRLIRRYTRDYRNLCQYIVEYRAVRIQEIGVSAIIEVNAGINIEQLLARIFFQLNLMITPRIHFTEVEQALDTRGSAEQVFDGPLLDSGVLTDTALGAQGVTDTLYTSDVLRIIFQQRDSTTQDVIEREDASRRDIISVRNLTLSNFLDNRPITTHARDCLHLVSSKRHVPRLSLSKSRIVIYRNQVEIAYDKARVIELYQLLRQESESGARPGSQDLPIPLGEAYDVSDYYPLQNDLPLVYGVGEAGLPTQANLARQAQAKQLKGFLFPIEQVMAGYLAQLHHFNRFFSALPDEAHTLYQQPLYHLSDVRPLLKAFDPNTETWEDFVSNKENDYAATLDNATETQQQFLNRRNAVLDHLMANLGADMGDRAALLLRRAATIDNAASLTLPELIERQQLRRQEAQQALIGDKSAYYYDLPSISRDRYQAYGNPVWRNEALVNQEQSPSGTLWRIGNEAGSDLLQALAPEPDSASVKRQIAKVMSLGTTQSAYAIRVEDGGERRLEIRSSAQAPASAESVASYASDALAQTGIQDTAEEIRRLWLEYALTPLECHLYHFLGIRPKRRRTLIHALLDFVEIFDEVPPGPSVIKGYRLWEAIGFGGNLLLHSEGSFEGPNDSEATAAARVAVDEMIGRGIDARNYRVEQPAAGVFELVLTSADQSALARSPTTFTSHQEALEAIDSLAQHIHFHFSAEGLYLVEHPLLYPAASPIPLQIPGVDNDPYSHQMTIVLPSGYARDFSLADAPRLETQPELYRSDEFKKFTEAQIRQHCPAEILPRVLWIDRALEGSPQTPGDASFDRFEQCYRPWLESYLTDEVSVAQMQPFRDDLTECLNNLYSDVYQS